MIMYSAKNAEGVSNIATPALDLGEETMIHYRLRLVAEWNHLVEKISVFEAGLDDFIYESVKTAIWTAHSGSNTSAPDTFLMEYARRGWLGGLTYHFVDLDQSAEDSLEIKDCGMYKKVMESVYENLGVNRFPNGEWAIVTQAAASERLKPYLHLM